MKIVTDNINVKIHFFFLNMFDIAVQTFTLLFLFIRAEVFVLLENG